MKNYDLYATMGTGFEAVVAKELQNLGYNTTTENGRVFFKGDIEDIIKTNINSVSYTHLTLPTTPYV